MTKKMYILMLALTVVSGLCGGMLAQRMFSPTITNTSESIVDGTLNIKCLNIVDEDGNSQIQLFGDESGGNIFIMGEDPLRVGTSLSAKHIMLFTGIMEPKVSIGVTEFGGYIETKDRYGIPDPR